MSGNLTSAQVLPGFFSYVDYNAAGAGSAPTLRALLFGTAKAGGQRPFNMPFRPANQQEADDGCVRGSELASWYASATSQPESAGADVWLFPIAEPVGGVASTYKLKTYVSSTNPSKSGTMSVWFKEQLVAQISFDTSDTAPTIAASLLAAINANGVDLPIGTATISTDTVTIPYAHKGATGEDFPFQAEIQPGGTGVQLSPGQALFTTAATGAGSVKISLGAKSVSTSIANTDTAAQIATKVAASWTADSYPLTAAVDGSVAAQVNFFFVNGKTVRRMTAAVITSTGTTVNLGSGATDGTGSVSSLSLNGTQGTGAASLTSALSNLSKLGMFRSWAAPWYDVATVGALATKIDSDSDGSITGQKQQTLTIVSPYSSAVAGAIGPATTPNLTTDAPRFAIPRCEDAPVQGMDVAARVAVARAAKWLDTPQFNWNGFQLKGNQRAPLPAPDSAPDETTRNSDLRTYALAPIVRGDSGYLEIVKGRTTSLSNDKRLWAWSTEAQAAYHAVDLPAYLRSQFQGTSTVVNTEPKAPMIIDEASVKQKVQERMRFWENQGNYDGADKFADLVDVKKDPNNPFRFNIKLPESPVLDLDQMVVTDSFVSPTA